MNMAVACCCNVPFDCLVVDCVKISGYVNIVGGGGTFGNTRISTLSPCADPSFADDGLGPYWDGTFPTHITTGDGCEWTIDPAETLWYSMNNGPGDNRKWQMGGRVLFTGGRWLLEVTFQGAVGGNNGTARWERFATVAEGPYGAYAFNNGISTPGAFDDAGCLLNVPTLTIAPC